MSKDSLLLQPLKVGHLTLKNRIMFPPLTTGYEERDGSIGERSLYFYERLAKGGASYVVIGDVAPVNTISPTPKLYDDSQIPTYRKLADALHAYDCKVALQIFHPEYDVPGIARMMHEVDVLSMEAGAAKEKGDMEGFQTKMAEAGKKRTDAFAKLHYDMQHFVSVATIEQLTDIKHAIGESARRAMESGIDAIEIHGDRLLGSLCSEVLNHRTDEYGGSFENRTRYALEVVDIIKKSAPSLMIEYKLPFITINKDGSYRGKGGLHEKEGIQFAQKLEAAGVDMIQVAQANHTGNMGDTIPSMGDVPYNWTLPIARKVKQAVSIPVSTVGRIITVANGEEILKNKDADMISYGRSLLCDPDIAIKVAEDEPIRECLNCNKGCVDAIQNRRYISCILNAENGDEATIFIKPASEKKKVIIIGAGIAGLEAARVAAIRGHEVTIYEKENQIGGQIHIAAAPPRKQEILRSIEYYEKILPSLGVTIHVNTVCTTEQMNQADAVIVAIGAHNVTLPIDGADSPTVVSAWDVLAGTADINGHCAVIGGGLVGTETAEYVIAHGCAASIIEMMDKIATGESSTVLPLIKKDFTEHEVKEYVNTKVSQITNQGKTILATNTQTNEEISIDCDTIIMAVGSKKNEIDLAGVTVPVFYAGDCSGEQTASIAEAVRSGYKVANEI